MANVKVQPIRAATDKVAFKPGDIVAVISPAKAGTYKDPSTKAPGPSGQVKDAGNATVAYVREDGVVVNDTSHTVQVTVWRKRRAGDVMV